MRAVLCGYYGMGNGGDEALLATLLQMLPMEVTPIVLSGNPAETAARYGVEAVPRKSFKAVWAALRQSDVFIWGGGSLMQDTTSWVNPLYYSGLMKLAQGLGLKTIAWAQGLGPLNRATSRWLTRWALQHCDAVSVRDVGSAKLLADWQIGCWLAPDPVWALASKPVPGLWDLPAPRVAVALRPSPSLTPARLALITQALVDFQKTTQTCILLVPFQPIKDLAIAAHVADQLPGPHQIFQLDDPTQLKGLFRGVEMTIGMRFHALVMSAAEGCRCYALSYDPKVTQLMQDVEMSGCDLSLSPPHPHSARRAKPYTPSPPHPFPPDARTLTQQWLELYVNGQPLTPDQIQSRLDRASLHQALLIDTLVGSDPSGACQNM